VRNPVLSFLTPPPLVSAFAWVQEATRIDERFDDARTAIAQCYAARGDLKNTQMYLERILLPPPLVLLTATAAAGLKATGTHTGSFC
jgi:hypothetical protein